MNTYRAVGLAIVMSFVLLVFVDPWWIGAIALVCISAAIGVVMIFAKLASVDIDDATRTGQ